VRRLALALALLGALVCPAGAALAVEPGGNGPLVFASGRSDGATTFGDANAQIWITTGPSRLTTGFNTYQHRHPAWSPDRTMIAYARCETSGCMGTGPWDIVIDDLTDAGPPSNITSAIAGSADRPSFSPDGTRIAYGRISGSWNIYTQPVNGGSGGLEDTVVATADDEEKPVWTRDSQTIIYQRNTGAGNLRDIYRVDADGGTGTGLITGANDDYQPGVSPDGERLCFVRGAFGSNNAEVKTSSITGAGGVDDVSPIDGTGSYNCVWSPDQEKIAYVNGIFGNGALVMRNSNGSGSVDTITAVDGVFDGNPDWVHDPPPTCESTSVTVGVNGFVSVPLDCADAPNPPNFADNEPFDPDILDPPDNGVLGGLSDNDTVIYTPNVNFEGTDTFTFGTSDGISESEPATVTITVGDDGGGGQAGDPEIGSFRMSRTRFRRGSELPSAAQSGVGTNITFDLSEAASVRFSFQRARKGRRSGGKCRRPTRRNKGKRRCTRYVRAGSFRLDLGAGDQNVRFEGRLTSRKRLKVGKHRLTLSARDNQGNGSNRPRKNFRILRG
jgi:dipeptidyl aminopeptidase/acylaminoacyl peptidase